MEPWRGTGRTQALITQAISHVEHGKDTLVLVASLSQVDDMVGRILVQMKEPALVTTQRVVKCGRASLQVEAVESLNRLRGGLWNEVLVDHFAWESRPFETAHALVEIEPSLVVRSSGICAAPLSEGDR